MLRKYLAVSEALWLPALPAETIRNADARNIAGGQPATVYDRPAVVLMVGVADPARTCTGSLINALWEFTVAHYLDGLPLENLEVSYGYPLYHETRLAAEAVTHPEYEPDGWADDVALVAMESGFLSRTTATLSMADSFDSLFLQPGATVTVVGWGDADPVSMMTAAEKTLVACPQIPGWAECT